MLDRRIPMPAAIALILVIGVVGWVALIYLAALVMTWGGWR